jgi:zinc/manganese transport system substrate-binding protein
MSVQNVLARVIGLITLVSLLSACGGSPMPSNLPAQANQPGTIPVVATFSIVSDLVKQVAGDKVTIRTLVEAGADAHTFDASPADSVALADASLIFENGLEFEPWLDGLYSASGSKGQRVDLSQGINAIATDEHHDEDEHDEDEHHDEDEQHDEDAAHHADDGHNHGEFDPHIWTDVHNVEQMVKNIRDALVAADAENADYYKANAEQYLGQLAELDAYIVQQTESIPADKRILVTAHNTMAYFADRYGYIVLGSALGSASTEAADPSASAMVNLIEQIKAAGIPAIFAENVQSTRVMQQIADEAKVQLAPVLYSDALGEAGSAGDSYISMMRYNIDTIANALRAQ